MPRGANGSDSAQPISVSVFFSDTDTDWIVIGYGYKSDIKRIHIQIGYFRIRIQIWI